MYPGLPTVTAPYAAERYSAPPRGAVTNTAPTTRLAMALAATGQSPRSAPRLWNSLPVEEVEGHHVDPGYDVRPVEGLGRAPIRSERLGLGVLRNLDDLLDRRQELLEGRAYARPSAVVKAATGAAVPASSSSVPVSTPAASSSAFGGIELGSMLVPLALLGGVLLLMRGRR